MYQRAGDGQFSLEPDLESFASKSFVRFAIGNILALIAVSAGATIVSSHIAHDEAVRDARSRGAGIARVVASPLLTSRTRAGDPIALAAMAHALQIRIADGPVAHIKLWDGDGRVIWSDQSEIVGKRFELTPEVKALFGTKKSVTEEPDLGRPENVGERGEGRLLEVYVGENGQDDLPFVFEAYVAPERLKEDTDAILREILPLALGVLLAFQLLVFPLGVSLSRRVARSHRQRSDIIRRALMFSDLERRRIARELHDGVISDLAGIAYALPLIVNKLPQDPSADDTRRSAATMSKVLQGGIDSLRTMIHDIYPSDLAVDTLATAMEELRMRAAESGVVVSFDVAPSLEIPPSIASIVFHIMQEGLRNVTRHSGASEAKVGIAKYDNGITVRVIDNGIGVDEHQTKKRGHFGLRLLTDYVHDSGGSFSLTAGDAGGTVLEAWIPATPDD